MTETDEFMLDISTHTPLAGRDSGMDSFRRDFSISTHTPLAGRDQVD